MFRHQIHIPDTVSAVHTCFASPSSRQKWQKVSTDANHSLACFTTKSTDTNHSLVRFTTKSTNANHLLACFATKSIYPTLFQLYILALPLCPHIRNGKRY